jgi:hypothetical protein
MQLSETNRRRFDAAWERIRWRGDKGSARCPFHHDHRPSLSINADKGLFFCHACGAKGNIYQFERRMAALRSPIKQRASTDMAKKKEALHEGEYEIVGSYTYLDEEGEPLFQKVRYKKKKFAFRSISKDGKWVWGLQDARRVIYNLPAVIEADEVFVVEGEKDADNVTTMGLVATCNPEGAGHGKWKKEYSKALTNKRVNVLQDNDQVGREHAKEVAQSVAQYAAEVRLIAPFPVGKDVSDWIAKGGTKKQLLKLVSETPIFDQDEPKTVPDGPADSESAKVPLLSGSNLVRKLELFFKKRVILPQGLALVIALWVIGTYLADVFDCFPYLCMTSPTKRCGKTILSELIGLVSARSKTTVNVSEAALFRMIKKFRPTIIMDEAETLSNRKSERAQFLLSLLNAGHRKNANVIRCVGPDYEVTEFPVYCPKVLLAIGNPPDTFRDRSVIVSMRRKRKDETVARYRYREVSQKGQRRAMLTEAWAQVHRKEVDAEYQDQLLDFLEDREADNWAPLFAIAAVAIPDRLEELKQIAVGLGSAKNALDLDDSEVIRLLSDIRHVFALRKWKAIGTDRLISELVSLDESPWEELTPTKLARMLRPFNVSSRQIWLGDKNVRGYKHDDFKSVFDSYLST